MYASPFIVGLGGTLTPGSASERVLRRVLAHCEALGAHTQAFCGGCVNLPHYDPSLREQPSAARALVNALAAADGIVICSPSYHGTISGLLKNAIDYTEELARCERPYLAERPVGLIAVAGGWQGVGSTLTTLRSIVHALRGWPTPLGVGINASVQRIGADGDIAAPDGRDPLHLLAGQVVQFAAFRADQPAPVGLAA